MNDLNLLSSSYTVNEAPLKLDSVCEIKIIKPDLKSPVEIA